MDWRLWVAAVLVVIWVGSAFLPSTDEPKPDPIPEPIDEKIADPLTLVRAQLLELHNAARVKSGADPLVFDEGLNTFAQEHAKWMTRFGMWHSRMGFGGFRTKGENIAKGQQAAESVTGAWMRSAGHRRNILNKRFTHVGFGMVKSSGGKPYWCAVFGSK